MVRKMVYKGELLEVVFLQTGKIFRKGEPTMVTEQEYQALKKHPDFERVKETQKQGEKTLKN